MIAILSVLFILALSILVTRIATVALTHTGLSRDAAAFQARSGFTGVGFTTEEAESVVNHPVRRRIIATLMLLGNVGIVTSMSSLILGFVGAGEGGPGRLARLALLSGGVLLLVLLARSHLVDRWLSRAISWGLQRWTRLEVLDYEALLHLSEEYRVRELRVRSKDWLAGETLRQLELHDEGIQILGIERSEGDYVGAPDGDSRIEPGDVLLVYGREDAIRELERRRKGAAGDAAHRDAVVEQREVRRREVRRDEGRRAGPVRSP